MKNRTKGIILIVIAIIMIVIMIARIFLFKNETKNDVSQVKNKISNEIEEQSNVQEIKETVNESETDEVNYLTGEDLPDEYYINPDFKIVGLTDDLKNLVNQKTNELNIAIQEYLYMYGYVGLPQATVKEYTQIVTSNQVVITFVTGLKDEITLQAIFNTADDKWNITAL